MKLKQILTMTAIVALTVLSASAAEHRGKEIYLDLMQQAVEAYTPGQIQAYIEEVDSIGITEHGFARLTANMGILIAHGRHQEMTGTFVRMMDICAREMPVALQKNISRGSIGNDFAVKEICMCILEVEAAGFLPKSKTDGWRVSFSEMQAADIYTCQPEIGEKRAHNWCVFGSASECTRIWAGIGGDRSYADRYLTDQLRWFDVNGMYKDPNQPMVYDMVTRLQCMVALYCGYDGPARQAIEELLLKSCGLTLQLQSVTGELPYGGRSNQFLHNETGLAALCEYYASWMKERGDMAMARRFKAAAERAVASLKHWTDMDPVSHIKNRYPASDGMGCEGYGYFNKYMVTMGSWAYLAYLFADDSIKPASRPEKASTFVTSPEFHMIMMHAGGYTVQFDIDAVKKYDCNGIGRFQKRGASPVVALSVPCPAGKPNYKLPFENDGPLAIAPLWEHYEIVEASKGKVVLTDGENTWTCRLSHRGLTMTLKGEGEQTMTLPALLYDGAGKSEVSCDGHELSIEFDGWRCRYVTDGLITDSGKTLANRNGTLRRYDATASGTLHIHASIDRL